MPPTDFLPQVTAALIDAIPDDHYKPCPCGCGKKWRYVVRDGEAEEHATRFCKNFQKTLDSNPPCSKIST